MRQYTPIWNEIKATGKCDVVIHRRLHQRVIHALWKEKDLDLGYKLESAESKPPLVATLFSYRKGSVLQFRLVIKTLITIDSV